MRSSIFFLSSNANNLCVSLGVTLTGGSVVSSPPGKYSWFVVVLRIKMMKIQIMCGEKSKKCSPLAVRSIIPRVVLFVFTQTTQTTNEPVWQTCKRGPGLLERNECQRALRGSINPAPEPKIIVEVRESSLCEAKADSSTSPSNIQKKTTTRMHVPSHPAYGTNHCFWNENLECRN
jgi:hypothetical protein